MAHHNNRNQMIAAILVISILATLLVPAKEVEAFSFGPLVKVGQSSLSPDGKHVSINIPGIFYMLLDTRGQHRGLKMDQSILSGFVRLNMDRTQGEDGKITGPMKITVGGITMFDNSDQQTDAEETE